MAPLRISIESGSEGSYDESLYEGVANADAVEGFAGVGPQDLSRWEQQGYLLVREAFSSVEIAEAAAAIEDMIVGQDGDYELSFEHRSGDVASLSAAQRSEAVRKVFMFAGVDERADALIRHPKLMDLLERLGLPRPQCFQTMALLKNPRGREKPWHQDKAYFNLRPEDRAVGVWIALDEATVENGCMRFLPGLHREPRIHFQRRDWQICDDEIARLDRPCVAAPMAGGDVLLFDSMLPHGTPRNATSQRRRALQFHYMAGDTRFADEDYRTALFGNEGKNVTC